MEVMDPFQPVALDWMTDVVVDDAGERARRAMSVPGAGGPVCMPGARDVAASSRPEGQGGRRPGAAVVTRCSHRTPGPRPARLDRLAGRRTSRSTAWWPGGLEGMASSVPTVAQEEAPARRVQNRQPSSGAPRRRGSGWSRGFASACQLATLSSSTAARSLNPGSPEGAVMAHKDFAICSGAVEELKHLQRAGGFSRPSTIKI